MTVDLFEYVFNFGVARERPRKKARNLIFGKTEFPRGLKNHGSSFRVRAVCAVVSVASRFPRPGNHIERGFLSGLTSTAAGRSASDAVTSATSSSVLATVALARVSFDSLAVQSSRVGTSALRFPTIGRVLSRSATTGEPPTIVFRTCSASLFFGPTLLKPRPIRESLDVPLDRLAQGRDVVGDHKRFGIGLQSDELFGRRFASTEGFGSLVCRVTSRRKGGFHSRGPRYGKYWPCTQDLRSFLDLLRPITKLWKGSAAGW